MAITVSLLRVIDEDSSSKIAQYDTASVSLTNSYMLIQPDIEFSLGWATFFVVVAPPEPSI